MPQKERSQFKAGLFIIVAVLLFFATSVGIKGLRGIFAPVEERHVRFKLTDDLGGLRIGDDVRIGGFKVGTVRKIDLGGLDAGQAPGLTVTFTMPKEYPVHTDAHIAIQTTVTGTSVLNIDALGSGDLLTADNELSGHPSSLTSLVASLDGVGGQVMDVVHEVKNTALPKIETASDRASDALASIHDLSNNANDVLGDSKTDLRGTFTNIHDITADVKTQLPEILKHADGIITKASTDLDNAKGTLEDLRTSLANAKDITAAARDVITNNRGRLDNIVAGLKVTSDNLKGASAEIRRSPWRLLYKPGPGEMDNLELYDATRQFADGANSVNDAAVALRDVINNPHADKAKVQELIEKLNKSFNSFNSVEEKLWSSVKPE